MRSFKLAILKNGVEHTTDDSGNPMLIREDDYLSEIMREYGFPVEGYAKVLVNGIPMEVSELDDYDVTADVKIQFVNKSEAGR